MPDKKGLIATGYLLLFVFLAIFFLIYLPEFFSGDRTIKPIILSIGAISFRWYGLLISLGALLAYFLIVKEASRDIELKDNIDGIVLWLLVFGLVGARLGFAIQNTQYFLSHPLDFFKIYNGGLSIQGALIAGIIVILVISKFKFSKFLKISKNVSPPVIIAIAIGRWGNFFNQEIIGKPAQYFGKMYVDILHRPQGLESTSFYHPVFLYESILLTIVFLVYHYFLKKRNIGLVYTLFSYSLVRLVVEFWRIDYKPTLLVFDLAQIVCLAIIGLSIIIYISGRRSKWGRHLDQGRSSIR